MRKAKVFYKSLMAGILCETDDGYQFEYDRQYLDSINPQPISLTLPLSQHVFQSKVLFPFFDGLIPEGWLLDISVKNWKLDPHDRMGLLMTCCRDCIGAVSVESINE